METPGNLGYQETLETLGTSGTLHGVETPGNTLHHTHHTGTLHGDLEHHAETLGTLVLGHQSH